MFQRSIELTDEQSFFLFGARGTGKSTLIKNTPFLKNALIFDLLDPDIEEELALRPRGFIEQIASLSKNRWVVVDEVQKIPELLSSVHKVIEEKKVKFAITGSSSRKLKRGGADMLAGRAVTHNLFPFICEELKESFELNAALQWGTLPKAWALTNPREKARYLRTYVQTYVKEEIVVEQLIRNLDPFRLFLPVAAQMNGQIINYSNISKDTGVDYKTIQNYYEILVETHIGTFLESFGRSVRKVQRQAPKFYFFDCGVKRALERRLRIDIEPGTSEYGNAFETWFINECLRLNSYRELDYQFSYLLTKDGVEIDLIIERPDRSMALVEIKSTDKIDERHIRHLIHFKKDFPKARLVCVSQVAKPRVIEGVEVLPWRQALRELIE